MRTSALLTVVMIVLICGVSQAQAAAPERDHTVSSQISCQLDRVQEQDLLASSRDISAATCLMCGPGSSGSCARRKGKARVQCHGSRSDCRQRGCRITGTASCSRAGNVQSC